MATWGELRYPRRMSGGHVVDERGERASNDRDRRKTSLDDGLCQGGSRVAELDLH